MALLEAAAFQPKAAARAILQDVFSAEDNRTIMNIAKSDAIDADFAKELYTRYKTKLDAESYHFIHPYGNNGSTTMDRVQYAYLISSLDPVEARLIMETEFANALSKAQHGGQYFELRYFPLAMCALDQDRAQVMLEAMNGPGPRFGSFLQQRFMQYILMPREKRVASLFF